MYDFVIPEDTEEEFEDITLNSPSFLIEQIRAIDSRYGFNTRCNALLLVGLKHLDETVLLNKQK